jgi:hypothetical protein
MTTYTTAPATMHSGHDIRDASGSMVAIVHSPAADPAQGAKIAALMSAAPDLLDLAYDFGQMLTGMDPYTVDDAAIMRNKIKAAITRATGAAQ